MFPAGGCITAVRVHLPVFICSALSSTRTLTVAFRTARIVQDDLIELLDSPTGEVVLWFLFLPNEVIVTESVVKYPKPEVSLMQPWGLLCDAQGYVST